MSEPRFLSDHMLARLGRWLCFLGYDSALAGKDMADDLRLMEKALREGRILLTRDTRLPEVRGLRKIVLREQSFEGQLKRVAAEAGLKADPARLFTRCTLCNLELEAESRERALAEAPAKVRELDTRFFRCPGCRRLYWSGTHVARAVETLRGMGLL